MENKEKFAFRKVSMTENVEIEFIKTLEDNANKSDEDLLKAFKNKLSSDNVTCHASMLSRTTTHVIFQISKFSKITNSYRDHELWLFEIDNNNTILKRFRI